MEPHRRDKSLLHFLEFSMDARIGRGNRRDLREGQQAAFPPDLIPKRQKTCSPMTLYFTFVPTHVSLTEEEETQKKASRERQIEADPITRRLCLMGATEYIFSPFLPLVLML